MRVRWVAALANCLGRRCDPMAFLQRPPENSRGPLHKGHRRNSRVHRRETKEGERVGSLEHRRIATWTAHARSDAQPDASSPGVRCRSEVWQTTRTTADTGTLILYDTSGQWGWLGEQYALAGANLASHFGRWSAKPVTEYTSGEMRAYKAVIYIGSTYNEPTPQVRSSTTRSPASPRSCGWAGTSGSSRSAPAAGRSRRSTDGRTAASTTMTSLRSRTRDRASRAPSTPVRSWTIQRIDTNKAKVIANAQTTDGDTFPWAIASGNLTYVGEIPFAYMKETDRYLIFSDLLFDVLAPNTQERHRAMVRLEDIGCDSDPEELIRIADYLSGAGVPFSFGVFPVYRDPKGAQLRRPEHHDQVVGGRLQRSARRDRVHDR